MYKLLRKFLYHKYREKETASIEYLFNEGREISYLDSFSLQRESRFFTVLLRGNRLFLQIIFARKTRDSLNLKGDGEMNRKEKENEIIERWNHVIELDYEHWLLWVWQRIEEYYSACNLNEDTIQKMTGQVIFEVQFMANKIGDLYGPEARRIFLSDISLTLIACEVRGGVFSPASLILSAVLTMLWAVADPLHMKFAMGSSSRENPN